MDIKIAGIINGKAVLNISSGAYRDLLKLMEWQHETEKPQAVAQAVEDKICKDFGAVFEKWLQEIGLVLRPEKVYRQWDGKGRGLNPMEAYCKGFKVIPGRENFLDGFLPRLSFSYSLEYTEEIKVACFVQKEGHYLLETVIDITATLMKLRHNGDELFLEKKSAEKEEGIVIAPLPLAAVFCKNAVSLAQTIGVEALQKIHEAKGVIAKAPKKSREEARSAYALLMTEALGLNP